MDWKEILSGVLQRSVQDPLLFVLYINDLSEVIGNNMKLHADDAKKFEIADTILERKCLQGDLNRFGCVIVK